MHNFIDMRVVNITAIALCLALVLAVPVARAAPVDTGSPSLGAQQTGLPVLAEAEASDPDNVTPPSGTVVLPTAPEKENSEKKCMTVCKRWGQECMYDNNRGRKCRRTCKEFGEECF